MVRVLNFWRPEFCSRKIRRRYSLSRIERWESCLRSLLSLARLGERRAGYSRLVRALFEAPSNLMKRGEGGSDDYLSLPFTMLRSRDQCQERHDQDSNAKAAFDERERESRSKPDQTKHGGSYVWRSTKVCFQTCLFR